MIREKLNNQGEIYVVLTFVVFRYARNLAGGLTMDEVFYAQAGLSMFHGYMFGNPTHMHSPLIKYFIGLSQVLFGVSETTTRLPVALFGLAAIYATYRVGRYIFNREIGALAAVLLAALPDFNYYSTMAMLDVPLALFVLLGLGTIVWWLRDLTDGHPPMVLGVLTVLAGATKVQGAIYVIGILGAFSWISFSEPAVRRWPTVKRYLVAATASFILIYLPFAVSPAPAYYAGSNPPELVETLFAIPWIGSIGYAFAASFVHNLSHLGNGHFVTVLGETYTRPPSWVLLYWLGSKGGIPYLIGFGTALIISAGYVKDRGVRIGLVFLLLLPFLVHALLSVKLSRYLVPLYPVLAITAAFGFAGLARYLRVVGTRYWKGSSAWTTPTIIVVLVLVASLLPPSFALTATNESIQTDTAMDDAAHFIVEKGTVDEPITAIVSNPLVYRWYLGEHLVGNFSKDVQEPTELQRNGVTVRLTGDEHENTSRVGSSCIVIVPETDIRRETVNGHSFINKNLLSSVRDKHASKRIDNLLIYDTCLD